MTLDVRVLAFAGAIALGVALLAGTLPAMQTAFGNLAETLNRGSRGSSGAHSTMRRVIVIGEVALSLVLVSGALLLFRSLLKLQALDTGVRMENTMTMSVDLPLGAYRTPQQAALFYQAAAERLQAAPGVAQAGISTVLPLQWISNGEIMMVAGLEKPVRVRFKRVDPGYFRTLGDSHTRRPRHHQPGRGRDGSSDGDQPGAGGAAGGGSALEGTGGQDGARELPGVRGQERLLYRRWRSPG